MRMKVGSGKLIELEALRGIAALIVFNSHFCEGLVPNVTSSINGSLLFVALNGPAAVIVFFVLSGFVLTLRPLQTRDLSPFLALTLKRWPRLAGPVTIAGLAYSLSAMLKLFPRPGHLAVALPPHVPPYLFWGQAQHNERLGEVLSETLAGTFLRESAQHNSVLWTMHWEFLGSFLAITSAIILLLKLPRVARLGLFFGLWAAAAAYSPWLIAFPIGVAGAAMHRSFAQRIHVANWSAILMIACGGALLSWDIRVQDGIWAWMGPPRISVWVITESVAAGLWMAVALYNPFVRRWLSSWFGALCGRLSFPFYLVHLLVLYSFSSWLYILVFSRFPAAESNILLYLFSLITALMASIPLMMFDRWWVAVLGRYLGSSTSFPKMRVIKSCH
jgi:peptidoglycan/LPS O-acetylase OafA/YrhL